MRSPHLPRVLDAAADLIEADGWWDGGRDVTGDCVVTAIGRATRGKGTFEVLKVLRVFVEAADLVAWNDAQPDGDAVVKYLRECADALRGANRADA